MIPSSTILLVEDNPRDEKLALRALRKSNLLNSITVVRDGAEALDWLFATGEYSDRKVEDKPAVVLLDLQLPKINGLEVLRQIHADPRTRLIPVVILTSSDEDKDIKKGYELGANSYICKPLDFDGFSKVAVHPIRALLDDDDQPLPQRRQKVERHQENECLEKIEWLLEHVAKFRMSEWKEFVAAYRNLSESNSLRVILDAVDKEDLGEIVIDYLGLLESSGAIYETNADYSLGIFLSGWCQLKHRLQTSARIIGLMVQQHEITNVLSAINQELEAFTYAVAHDLRAPLRAIDGFSKVVLEDYEEKLDEEGKEYLHYIREGSQEMGELINGLLKLSRSTRGELSYEWVNLSAVAAETIEALRKAEPERQVRCRISPGVKGYGDARLLKTALENLLGNAWKYTGNCVDAEIEFTADFQEGHTVYSVRDNGAGFDMTYADNLFIPFKRLHKTMEFSGTGIGLSTAQRIVHRHGGRIWAEAEIGKGAVFFFTLGESRGA